MDRLEILIDNLLFYLPPDIPFLVSLMQRPEGRYIVFGLTAVIALLVVWMLLAVLQMVFLGQLPKKPIDKTLPTEPSKLVETESLIDTEAETENGFSFFKKTQEAGSSNLIEDPELVAIEQEMLAVRSLYIDGQILKDVYVSETRRLYAAAHEVKNNRSE